MQDLKLFRGIYVVQPILHRDHKFRCSNETGSQLGEFFITNGMVVHIALIFNYIIINNNLKTYALR